MGPFDEFKLKPLSSFVTEASLFLFLKKFSRDLILFFLKGYSIASLRNSTDKEVKDQGGARSNL